MKDENIEQNILIVIDMGSLKIINKFWGQLTFLNIYKVP